MLIIFTSHAPHNYWGKWIPGRFGFSDATEMFVFCSGMASAIAFGTCYDRHGWWLGTARVLQRCWQVYWAHIGLFFSLLLMVITLDRIGFEKSYVDSLALGFFLNNATEAVFGLMTLTYVPNYFDILPMYIVVLLMMPIIIALSRISLRYVAAFIVVMWFLAQTRLLETLGLGSLNLELPASFRTDRPWFFNPFGWQLIFFTGFAFMRGWIPRPPVNTLLIIIATAITVGFMTLSHVAFREWGFDWALRWRIENIMLIDKTNLGVLRYVHFLVLAYLAYAVAGEGGRWLLTEGRNLPSKIWKFLVTVLTKVGQQSLAVFMVSMVLSIFVGFILDQTGNSAGPVALCNLLGWAFLVAVAYGVSWFKSQPWKRSATG